LHPLLLCFFPLTALLFLGVAVVGTDKLGRPLTDDEKKRFGALLREHDYPGKRLIGLRYAYKLTRSRQRAQELMGRADLRLVRSGWDPNKVPLEKAICRLVWSEWTHAASESEAAKKAEEGFLRELEVTEGLKVAQATPPKTSDTNKAPKGPGLATPSVEQQISALEAEKQEQTKASVKLEKLRAIFEKNGDEVNLLWLKFELADVTDMRQMAAESGRSVEEFYAATKRRHRAVKRLLANDQGVDWEEES
jgi:hypothetical protein